ncbi:MFS transporter [Allopusillimonas ginsengisoli]|uniref:MFS transporter n=1 Tax=Allopusillimonas ginsengisoli TaxID=453575 RepID=UPI001021E487|nr:MFS transporter [Allopusillimonas ginsengisoli]TEA77431.1 MFS transporter [Allopusillimonas ginsengisoli]
MNRTPTAPARTHKTALLLTASTGCAMTVLDTNVVGIILPTIARDLNASFADIEWVISTYVLCFAALLLPAGSVSDRYGRKRIFLSGILLFAVASLACGLAPSAQALYVARAVQGAGAAFLLAPALAIIGHAFQEEGERAHAWAIWGGIMGLTMVLSPLAGGLINAFMGWRWAFHLNIPICAALAIAVVKIIEESRDPSPGSLDFIGIGLFASAMFICTWALILGPEKGWLSIAVSSRIVLSAFLFLLFYLVERRRQHPMLDLALFSSWPFVGAVLAMFAYAATAQVMASLLPLFLQNAQGHSSLTAGVGMLPFALAMLVLPQVGRWLSRYMASFHILTLGLAIVAFGNAVMMGAAHSGNNTALVAGMTILGSGGGLLNGETQKAIMGTIPRHRAGMGSGISTTSRFSGILLGFAGLGGVMAASVRTTVQQQLAQADLAQPEAFVERMVAGDFERALELFPVGMNASLLQIGRASYALGFAHAFMVAAVIAGIAAIFVFWAMSRTPLPAPVSLLTAPSGGRCPNPRAPR